MASDGRDRETSEPEWRSMFEAAPALLVALAPDLTILEVSDAYLEATMSGRDVILGTSIFDAFPENPGDASAAIAVAHMRASFDRVRAKLGGGRSWRARC